MQCKINPFSFTLRGVYWLMNEWKQQDYKRNHTHAALQESEENKTTKKKT
jgi:hypothetical protein